MPTRRSARVAALLAVLLVAGACGGEGGEGGEGSRPTISPTRTPTGTLPSPTGSPDGSSSPELPSPTRTPDETNSPTLPSTTRTPTRTPTQTETPTPTPTPTADETAEQTPTEAESEPEPVPTTEPVPPDSSDEVEDATGGDETVPSWAWWLLALLLVGAAVGVPLIVRSRRREGWRRELAAAESEVTWFARGLLPELRQVGSHEQLAGGWTVGRPRVSAAEDRLTGLESTAPDELDRDRARSLRDAVRLARERVQQLSGPGQQDTWALDLDAVMADLEVVLDAGTPHRPRDGAG